MAKTYKDLKVWQTGIELAKEIYKITENFPKEEVFGLTSQMRRCAVSIPSNIAEGKLRGYQKEFKKFLLISFGSGGELETQIILAKSLAKTSKLDYAKADDLLDQTMKMLNVLINKLEPSA